MATSTEIFSDYLGFMLRTKLTCPYANFAHPSHCKSRLVLIALMLN